MGWINRSPSNNRRVIGKPNPGGVVIDDRERASKLDEAIRRICGVEPSVERLQIGDVLVSSRILIERKAVADFSASIVDGRLFDQVSRLSAAQFQPILILEGEMTGKACGGLGASALRGAILSVTLDWHVPVLRSRSIEDTARWIHAMLLRGEKFIDAPDWRWVTPEGRRRPREEVQLRPRRKQVTAAQSRRSQEVAILSQIDGLGAARAGILLDRFNTVAAILAASPGELATVPGVGRILAANIHAVLHGSIAREKKEASK